MLRISSFAGSYIRRRAAHLMVDECRIWTPGAPVVAPGTKIATRGVKELKYEGPCRLWEAQSGSQVIIGEEQVSMTQTFLSLPYTAPIPEPDDICQITKSVDIDLVGRTVSIVAITRGGGLRASRRFLVRVVDSKRGEW